MVKYMYEVKDTETKKLLTPVAITGQDVGKLLGCSQSTVIGAYHGNHLIRHRYMIERVDTVIPQNDSIWLDWDLRRNWLLRICKEGKTNDGIYKC